MNPYLLAGNMFLVPHVLAGPFLAPQVDYTCVPPDNGYTVTSVTYDSDGTNQTNT